jgi:hypothetical protein
MANVVLQQGDVAILDRLRLDGQALHTLHLYQNNHTPSPTDVNGSYTEATFSGYGAVLLGTWTAAFVNGSGQGEIDAAMATFTHNGGGTANTIYGAYVTDQAGDVVYAELFPAPQVMSSLGNSISYTPAFTAVTQ